MMMLVEFAYSQELCITGDNCCDVMVGADYYGFAEAVDKCISYMEAGLPNGRTIVPFVTLMFQQAIMSKRPIV